MGRRYTITNYAMHYGNTYSHEVIWEGESLLRAIYQFIKLRKGLYNLTLKWSSCD